MCLSTGQLIGSTCEAWASLNEKGLLLKKKGIQKKESMSNALRVETVAVVKRLLLASIILGLVTPAVLRGSHALAEAVTEPRGASQAGSQADENDPNIALLSAVWERLVTVAAPLAPVAWPPQLHLLTDSEMTMAKMVPKDPNAFATLYKGTPL